MKPSEKQYVNTVLKTANSTFQAVVKIFFSAQAEFDQALKHKIRVSMKTLYPELTSKENAELLKDQTRLMNMIARKRKQRTEAQIEEKTKQLQTEAEALAELEESVRELSEL